MFVLGPLGARLETVLDLNCAPRRLIELEPPSGSPLLLPVIGAHDVTRRGRGWEGGARNLGARITENEELPIFASTKK